MAGAFQVGAYQPAYQQVQGFGGWIFKRERTYRRPEVEDEEEEAPKPKKSRRATLKVIKRAALQAAAENKV